MRRTNDGAAGVQVAGGAGSQTATGSDRQAYTFHLDPVLVERVRQEIGEVDVIRSIEAALAAALDYQTWVREVAAGDRSVLS
jgi:hypothetical protein